MSYLRRVPGGSKISRMKTTRTLEGLARVPEWSMGDRLRKAREDAGMEQVELAAVTGLSRQTISNYERNAVHARKSGLRLWSMATNVSLEWLESGVCRDFRAPGEQTPRRGNVARSRCNGLAA